MVILRLWVLSRNQMSFVWKKLMRPVAFSMDAERAHEFGMAALRRGLASPWYVDDQSFGFEPIEHFGLKFKNPLGLAAGFDKNGVAVEQLARLGFGFVEVGTVTQFAQRGNEKPRMFRLADDAALINRLGFNNDGSTALADRLRQYDRICIIGVNIGKNKEVPNDAAIENFVAAFESIHDVADYITVNVSSPNTLGLRDLQNTRSLDDLLSELTRRNRKMGERPLLVKIAPDLADSDIDDIVDVCVSHGCSGIIATNTTISREGLHSKDAVETGGLSGRPLAKRANAVISRVFRRANGRLAVVGVGGVFLAEDAFEKIRSGASLVQAYTGFIYGGPSFAAETLSGLSKLLEDNGFADVASAVGTAA